MTIKAHTVPHWPGEAALQPVKWQSTLIWLDQHRPQRELQPVIWGASLFMFLLVSMLPSHGAGAGTRLALDGLIIIGIVIAASTGRPPG